MSWDLDRLLGDVVTDEGFRGITYMDTTGHLTIGYGRNLEAHPYTRKEAEVWTRRHLEFCSVMAETYCGEAWRTMNDVRQEVIINMAYQLGYGGLSTFVQMRKAVRAGDWNEAARQGTDSQWGRRHKARRTRLMDELRTGLKI